MRNLFDKLAFALNMWLVSEERRVVCFMPVPVVHLISLWFWSAFWLRSARLIVKVCTKIFLVDCILVAFLARNWTLFQGMHIAIRVLATPKIRSTQITVRKFEITVQKITVKKYPFCLIPQKSFLKICDSLIKDLPLKRPHEGLAKLSTN